MKQLLIIALLAGCAVPKKKTLLQKWVENHAISTDYVIASSITFASPDVYRSSFSVSNEEIWFRDPVANPETFQFTDRRHRHVFYHNDGRITWSGGFTNDREVIRFLVESVAEIHNGHTYPLK